MDFEVEIEAAQMDSFLKLQKQGSLDFAKEAACLN